MEETHQSGNGSTGKGGSISISVGSSDSADDGGSLFMTASLTSASSAADFINF